MVGKSFSSGKDAACVNIAYVYIKMTKYVDIALSDLVKLYNDFMIQRRVLRGGGRQGRIISIVCLFCLYVVHPAF